MEQLRRNKPLAEEKTALSAWNTKQQALLDRIWQGLRVAGNLHEKFVCSKFRRGETHGLWQ
jgi:hypothetical protein